MNGVLAAPHRGLFRLLQVPSNVLYCEWYSVSEQSAPGKEQFSSLIMSDNFMAEATELGPSLTDTAPDRARLSENKGNQY